nr:OTU domain-containing protein 1-like [Macaca fascicularis]
MAVVVAAAAPSALRVAPLTLDCAGLLPWCRPCRAPSPPLAAPPSSFLSPPPPPPPALEFRRSLPPPPPSASSPKASRRRLHEPKHKHSSPTAGATSAVRCRPRRHVAARSELRPFVTSCHRQCPRSIRFPAPSRIPPRPGLFAGRGEARCHVTLRVALTGAGRLSPLPPPQVNNLRHKRLSNLSEITAVWCLSWILICGLAPEHELLNTILVKDYPRRYPPRGTY